MTAPTLKATALDADVPRAGRAADAYEVACTAAKLSEWWQKSGQPRYSVPPHIFARHAVTLHRISGHLHKLAERQCNEDLECPDCGGGGWSFFSDQDKRSCRACAGTGRTTGRREGLLETQAREIAGHYGLRVYFQTDPRGCSLYLIDPAMIPMPDTAPAGRWKDEHDARWIDANYTNGHAVARLGG